MMINCRYFIELKGNNSGYMLVRICLCDKIKVVITSSSDIQVPLKPRSARSATSLRGSLLAPLPPRARGSEKPVPLTSGSCNPTGQNFKLQLEIWKKEQEEKQIGWHRVYLFFPSVSGKSLQICVSTYWACLHCQCFMFYYSRESFCYEDCPWIAPFSSSNLPLRMTLSQLSGAAAAVVYEMSFETCERLQL